MSAPSLMSSAAVAACPLKAAQERAVLPACSQADERRATNAKHVSDLILRVDACPQSHKLGGGGSVAAHRSLVEGVRTFLKRMMHDRSPLRSARALASTRGVAHTGSTRSLGKGGSRRAGGRSGPRALVSAHTDRISAADVRLRGDEPCDLCGGALVRRAPKLYDA
jgi:hypothetical protein